MLFVRPLRTIGKASYIRRGKQEVVRKVWPDRPPVQNLPHGQQERGACGCKKGGEAA
nr:MAG TPA: hypothetical protein [Caudoviricetes sp.]